MAAEEKAPSQPINTITLLFAGFTRQQIIDAQQDDPSEAQLALNLGINTNPLDPASWNEYTSLHSEYFQEAQQNKVVNGQNQIDLKAEHESFNVPPNQPYHTSYQDHLDFIDLMNNPIPGPFNFAPILPLPNPPEGANKEQAGGKYRKYRKSLFKKKRTKRRRKRKTRRKRRTRKRKVLKKLRFSKMPPKYL